MWKITVTAGWYFARINWFHRRENLFYKHRIPLAETDVYTPPLRWRTTSQSGVMNATKSISINPPMCLDTTKNFP